MGTDDIFIISGFLIIIASFLHILKATEKKLMSITKEKISIQMEVERVERLYDEAVMERDALSKMAEAASPDSELNQVSGIGWLCSIRSLLPTLLTLPLPIRKPMHR